MIDICAVCQQTCEYIDCPTGGWWAHLTHPADGHDADPWARQDANDEARSQLTDAEHDPRDF